MRLLVPVVLGLALAAGCVSPGPPATPPGEPDWPAIGASLFQEHDHADRALHREVALGLTVLNWSALSEDGRSLGWYSEVDHARGLVAVTASVESGASFALFDAGALPAIRPLASVFEPGAYGDVKLDREEPLLYHAHPGGSGVAFSIWDVADPSAPARLGEGRGAGCHTVHPQRLRDAPHVWCTSLNGPLLHRIERLPDGSARGVPVAVAFPQGDPEVARYATYYAPLTPVGPALVAANHDMTAQMDPLDPSRPLLVDAHELQGLRVFDLSTPEAPVEIARWRGEGLDGEMPRIHQAFVVKLGERRVALAGTETFARERPVLFLVDLTDYAAPKLLSTWSPPGYPHDQGLYYSMHNAQIVGSRMYVANFHGGAWVVDVADPGAPRVIALRVPVRDAGFPEPGRVEFGFALETNMVDDVILVNGYLVLSDMPAGIEVVCVDGDPCGDPAHASFA